MPHACEKRTYSVTVGQISEVTRLYSSKDGLLMLAAPWGPHP